MSERPRQQIAQRAGNHNEPGRREAANAKKNSSDKAARKAGQRQQTCGNAGLIQNGCCLVEQPTKGPAESFDAHVGGAHAPLKFSYIPLYIIMDRQEMDDLKFLHACRGLNLNLVAGSFAKKRATDG